MENRNEVLLKVDHLCQYFRLGRKDLKAVNDVSFEIKKGETFGLVGESGCGKSVTSLSVMQLVQAPQGQVTGGEIRFNSSELGENEKGEALAYDITKMPTIDMCRIRGKDISMIFQEPMTSLNPVFTIGQQLDEVSFIHDENVTKESARAKSLSLPLHTRHCSHISSHLSFIMWERCYSNGYYFYSSCIRNHRAAYGSRGFAYP